MQTALPQIFATISCNFFYFLHDHHQNYILQFFLYFTSYSPKMFLQFQIIVTNSNTNWKTLSGRQQKNRNLKKILFSTSSSPSLTLIENLECRLLKSRSPIKSIRVFPSGTRTLAFLSIVLTT